MGYIPSLVVKWYFSNKPLSSNLYLSLFLLLWMVFSIQKGVAFGNSDKYVLLQFKESVTDPEGLLSSWRAGSSDHCSWPGVSCDSSSRVVSLNITGHGGGSSDQNQSICYGVGKLPLYGFGVRRDCSGENGSLVGKLPDVIAKLTELRVLSLPFNGFHGEIPSDIWGMGKLEVMDLEGNSLSGLLPNWFPGLTNLRVLNLGFNKIKGGIPNSLAACLSLEILNLAGNQINGTLLLSGFIGRLREVYLSFNMLQGNLPSDIGDHCDKLEHLDLSGNFFSGEIPQSLGKCSEMRSLLLYMNMLEETIPGELGQLKKLEVFDVSRNSLSGKIPVELGNCSSLSVLVLSSLYNPYEDINGRKDGFLKESGLVSINDDFNFYQGGIPVELTRLPKLRLLWAPRATLEGKLPSDWGNNMEMISLGRNFFTGDIPIGLSHCKKLRLLDLSSNRLTGKLVDELDGLAVHCMMVFDVSRNGLTGSLPKKLDSTNCTDVSFDESSSLVESYSYISAYLSFFMNKAQLERSILFGNGDLSVIHNFGDNNFTGGLESMTIAPPPERLGRRRVSYTFYVGGNNLSGQLPNTLFDKCDGFDAVYINVSYNSLFGKIPSEIGKLCETLTLFDASRNQISGGLPDSLGGLLSLVVLDLSSNMLQDKIPNSVGKMNGLRFLSLAGNQLSGIIPSSFGKLKSLELLDLSSNSLDGEIPDGLVNLKNLTALLLNNNKLSGHIPSGLANITTLSIFNVSFNNLSGLLPLSNDSMKCNKVLGNPYLQPCRMFSLSVPSSDQSGGIEGDSQNYAASPLVPETKSEKTGFNSIEIASIASASAIVSVLIALIALFIYTRIWHPKSKIMGTTKKK